MKNFIFFLLGFACFVSRAQKAEDAFTAHEAEKIINVLASDDMMGRKAFTPEIDKAAAYIAAQFKKSGLATLDGAPDYLQSFAMVNARFKGLNAVIDGNSIDMSRIIVLTATPELAVNENSGYNILSINPEDDFLNAAFNYTQNGKNNIVLVDSSFANRFGRLTFLKRNFLKTTGSTIFILGNPQMKSFAINASHEIKQRSLTNVVGVVPGNSRKDEYVIFSGHYDHLGIGKPQNGDSIYNGANDDASGTAAVMMLAEYFKKEHNNQRTLVFVAFTAEEIGGFGAAYFSRTLPTYKIVAMLNIEMIGSESKWGKNTAYITGFEKSSLGDILKKNLVGSDFNFYPDPYPGEQLFYRSDNTTFARLGIPAHSISTAKMDSDSFYHKAGDELITLNMSNLASVIKAIGISTRTIVSGQDTPTRIAAEQLKDGQVKH